MLLRVSMQHTEPAMLWLVLLRACMKAEAGGAEAGDGFSEGFKGHGSVGERKPVR